MLAAAKPVASHYAQRWAEAEMAAQNHHRKALAEAPWCSLVAVDQLCRQLPEGIALHLSNGLSVRLAQICGARQVGEWWSNRGTSGIDGSTSTALGASIAAAKGKNVILITGDMSAQTEELLLSLYKLPAVDVLVAGHHGAKNATSAALLQALSPETVCISVGSNRYGHPAQSTLQRLSEQGCTVLRTDLQGTIHISLN